MGLIALLIVPLLVATGCVGGGNPLPIENG
jgi:hypothetical protein